MKTLIVAVLFGALTTSVGYSKPGGWFFDLLDRSSITVSSGYGSCGPQYHQQPVYYQQPRVIYYQQLAPVYYQQPAPVYYQQPYQNNSYNYHGRKHCR